MEEMKINISDNLADQRARAIELRAKLLKDMESRKGFRRDMIDAVTKNEWDNEWNEIIASALADERRRVWEEAAKDCRYQSRVYSGGELMKRNVLLNMADFFDAKAHAGQEG